ncbi:MAG: Ig-like domain-containing protein [Enhygromyxa sp.]
MTTAKTAIDRWTRFAQVSLVVAALAGWACAALESEEVAVLIEGDNTLAIGETLQLTASTERGTDHGYAWASSADNVATVSPAGLVTGVAPGTAVITATGLDTKRSDEHVVVVIESEAGSPYYDRWRSSGHADAGSAAFTRWDEDGEIPSNCARCHSRDGFRDYIGDDQSEVGVVNHPAPTGTVVDCQTCHNDAASALDWVEFPSGVSLTGLGSEARCMTCHQGRASGDDIEQSIAEAGVGDDEISADLKFSNVHYYPAGATLYAGIARGGYQYEDQLYDRRLRHVPGFETCVGCHDPHSTRVQWDACAECHPGVEDKVGARDIRMIASLKVDYDGDGDTSEGIAYEIVGLHEKLYRAIQLYAAEVVGQPLCYRDARPYWYNSSSGAFADCSDEEAVSDNVFTDWTPRLLRATYNYHSTRKDPGAYAHNGRYIIKLLHDSIADLNSQLTEGVDMSKAGRNAPGHFNAASAAARHWDDDEAVSPSCSSCHGGAAGYRFYVEYGTSMEVAETNNGMECFTCHENFGTRYDTLEVASTRYPGGLELAHPGHDNMCATCHSGRASKATIDAAIAADDLRFLNVHYLPAAGVRNGSLSAVGYQYEGKDYAGHLEHASRTQCTGCHEPEASKHTFQIADVWQPTCQTCHNDQSGPEQVRIVRLADYDGDGNTSETLAAELDGLAAQVIAAMQGEAAICYEGHTFPYWFIDNGGASNGLCAAEDANFGNRFVAWTPGLMKAAHNYQLHRKDPGGYAHNFDYLAQLLIDSIEDLGGDVAGLVRP